MANGPQIAEENYQRFKEWILQKSDADFKALERRGVISRTDIVKECGFARSALTQNPRIKTALKDLEDGLRSRNILPPEVDAEETRELPMREVGTQKRVFDMERLRRLEQDNAALKEENAELKRQLSKYTVLQEALALTGRIPR
jgi:hypothetical protein